MLTHSASSLDSGPATDASFEPSGPGPERIRRPVQAAVPMLPGERYGKRGADPKVLGFVLALHVALVIALILSPPTFKRTATPSTLNTFEISQPAPPPPAAMPELRPDLPVPELVTPPPVVSLPLPSPVLAAPEPPPVRAVSQPAPAAAPAPAPVQAAPAPVTPPDFRAAQLSNPAPAYPFLSRRAREEGVVMLKVLVTPEGRAGDIAISQTSGFERLDEAALKTVRRWRFLPARQAGKPVEAWVLVPVTFSLG